MSEFMLGIFNNDKGLYVNFHSSVIDCAISYENMNV